VDVDANAKPERRPSDLVQLLSRKVIGQSGALEYITPYIQMYRSGLSAPDRPAGIFLLLGPTGTGKTRTVEALAEILHGDPKQLLKIDCAEYQADHEVAKLIGAPPGYIGHRETKPLLTQERLLGVISTDCDLALVLFDEVEKAAPSLTTLLLGMLDKGTLRLGDNTTVVFEKALIFLTSNLGAREMLKEMRPSEIGFHSGERRPASDVGIRLEHIGLAAVRKRFSPEFVNRIDAVITYRPLDVASLAEILDAHIIELQKHVHTRLAGRSFLIEVTPAARALMLEKGVSDEYGARELKRTIHRLLTQPLAALVAEGRVEPGGRVTVDLGEVPGKLRLSTERPPPTSTTVPGRRSSAVLLVDDNEHIVEWLQRELTHPEVTIFAAGTAEGARRIIEDEPIDLAVVDLMLPDGDGLVVALELLRASPRVRVVMMTGGELSDDELAVCERQGFPILRKPFLAADMLALVKASLSREATAGR
jgi:ATP-dependent Clp protease ATP-binding subunit ClpA/CheY-like chemotaxis protein